MGHLRLTLEDCGGQTIESSHFYTEAVIMEMRQRELAGKLHASRTRRLPQDGGGGGLPSRLRAYRQERKLTLAQLGLRLGVSPPMICHIECGRKNASRQLRRKIEHMLAEPVE